MEVLVDVPYRCPRCGKNKTFNTLAELRSHMSREHAYTARKRQRLKVFNFGYPEHTYALSGRYSPLLQSYLDEGKRLEKEVKAAKKEELNNKIQRQRSRSAPLVKSNRIGNIDSVSSMHSLSPTASRSSPQGTSTPKQSKIKIQPVQKQEAADEQLQETFCNLSHELMVQRHNHWQMADTLYTAQDVMSGVEEAAEQRVSEQKNLISYLTKELSEKEKQLQQLAAELEKFKEQTAKKLHEDESEEKQIGEILERKVLEDKLADKQIELENISKQLSRAKQNECSPAKLGTQYPNSLNANRVQDVQEDTDGDDAASDDKNLELSKMRRNFTPDSSSLNTEEDGSDCSTSHPPASGGRNLSVNSNIRSIFLKNPQEHTTKKLFNTNQNIVHSYNRLRGEAQDTKITHVQKMKEERQLLVQQMKELLSKANTDNIQLKDELIAKENHLKLLNQELKRSKTDQTELLEETFDLYREAEKNLSKLKEMLKMKEAQLSSANIRLKEVRSVQEKLVAEREDLVKSADKKDALYQKMMMERDDQIKHLNSQLASIQDEQQKLIEKTAELRKEMEVKEKSHAELMMAIGEKEQELKKAKEDVEALSTFLQTAAAKEAVARCKLEAFVTELIGRADRAEKELLRLRELNDPHNNFISESSLSGVFPGAGTFAAKPEDSSVSNSSHVAKPHSTIGNTQQNNANQKFASISNLEQILQNSLEPWYDNLSAVGIPGHLTAETVADINASNQMAAGASYVPPAMSTPHKLTSTISLPSPVPRRRNLIYTTQKPEPLPLSESSQEFTPLPARRRNTQPDQAVAKYVPRSQVPSAIPSGQISKKYGRYANLKPDADKRQTSGDAVVQSASRNEYTYTDDSDSSLTRYQELENYPGFKESALTPKHAFALKRSPASSRFCSGGTRSNHVGPIHLESPEESDIADFHRNIGRLSPVRRERENGDPRNHRKSSLKGSRVNADGGIKSPDITDDLTGQHVEGNCSEEFGSSIEESEPKASGVKFLRASNKKTHWKSKIHSAAAHPLGSHLEGQTENSSTEGLELSIDENGILWDASCSSLDASDSYRARTSGSETAGDVDSSVLLSSCPQPNIYGLNESETDDDIDDLVDDRQAQFKSNAEVNRTVREKQLIEEKKNAHIPLGERISRILKCGTVHDSEADSESKGITSCTDTMNKAANFQPSSQVASLPVNKTESPLERALAVQERVKSLTVPREKSHSATTSPIGNPVIKSLEMPKANKVVSSNLTQKLPRKTFSDVSKGADQNEQVNPTKESSFGHQSPPCDTPLPSQKHVTIKPVAPKPDSQMQSKTVTHLFQKNNQVKPFSQEFESSQMKSAPLKHEKKVSLNVDDFGKNKHRSEVDKQKQGNKFLSVNEQGELCSKENFNLSSEVFNPKTPLDFSKTQANFSNESFPLSSASSICEEDAKIIAQSSDALENASCMVKPELIHPLQTITTCDPSMSTTPALVSVPKTELTPEVRKQMSISGAPLLRQDSVSVSTDEGEFRKFETAPLKPANMLRARFSEPSQSLAQSFSEECTSSPSVGHSQLSLDREDNDSTDFDSDFEKLSPPGDGLKRGVPVSKLTAKRFKTKQRKARFKKIVESKNNLVLSGPDIIDDTSSTSDQGHSSKARQEARLRRVTLFCVFSYLDTRNLGKMALVCKEWRRVSRHPALWKCVCLKYERISSRYLVTISKWCTQLTSLTLEGLRAGSRRANETMDEYKQRTKASLEPGLEELLKASQNSLTSLSIIGCGNILTDKCLWLVSGYCRLLKQLTYLSDTHPVTAEVLWALGGGCPSITSLVIPPLFPCHASEGMTNRCLQLIAQFYPDLVEVGIGGHSLDIIGLAPLVQSCQRLQYMSLDHIKDMKDDTAIALCRTGLKNLQRLEIIGTPISPQAIRCFYSSCRHLKEIRIFFSIGDLFEDECNSKNKEEYKKLLEGLEDLKSQAGLGNILCLRAAPID